MPSYDLATFLEDDALVLKGVASEKHPNGKSYTIKSPSAKMGLRLQRVMQLWQIRGKDAAPSAEDVAELLALVTDEETGEVVDLNHRLMGDTYQEMVDDGVSADRLDRITSLVTVHYGQGAHLAKMLVEAATEGNPQARANRATRRAAKKTTAKKTAGSRSSRASGATTESGRATRSSTSGSSTRSRTDRGNAKAG